MIDTTDALHAHANLRYIVEHWRALQSRLIPGGGNALTGMPTGGDAPAPIDVAVSDLLFEIEEEARSLGHVLMDETTWTPSTSAMPTLLAEVAERYGHWTAGDARTALEFCDWAEEYATKVARALEPPAPAAYIGACRECGGDLYLRPVREVGKCRCGVEFRRDEQMAIVGVELDARLMSQTEIVTALVVLGYETEATRIEALRKTVRTWVFRSRLVEAAPDLYRLADAVQLADERALRVAR